MGGSGTSVLGFRDPPTLPPKARMPPLHSFISLIIRKANQILKNQTKLLLAVPPFLVQASQEAGAGGEGTLPSD